MTHITPHPFSIEPMILQIRCENVILDTDLAILYGVTTKALNQAVRRNSQRFPSDFLFQRTKTEKAEVVTFCDHLKNVRYSNSLPYAFTEHGPLWQQAYSKVTGP
jgi:hypothetical protein